MWRDTGTWRARGQHDLLIRGRIRRFFAILTRFKSAAELDCHRSGVRTPVRSEVPSILSRERASRKTGVIHGTVLQLRRIPRLS